MVTGTHPPKSIEYNQGSLMGHNERSREKNEKKSLREGKTRKYRVEPNRKRESLVGQLRRRINLQFCVEIGERGCSRMEGKEPVDNKKEGACRRPDNIRITT